MSDIDYALMAGAAYFDIQNKVNRRKNDYGQFRRTKSKFGTGQI